MERVRSRFQGVSNVFRFNWHFYLLSAVSAFILFIAGRYFEIPALYILGAAAVVQSALSLGVTFYVYDLSNLYGLEWLDGIAVNSSGKLVTLNAGFDETSEFLKLRYPNAELLVFDFYDAAAHTEVSIKRARQAQSVVTEATKIRSSNIPVGNDQIDAAFLIFSAHEIRNNDERIRLFAELRRICKEDGRILVTEHLRDAANFFAYNIGAFHFLPGSRWNKTFEKTGLMISGEIKITPFVTTFVLKKNGRSS